VCGATQTRVLWSRHARKAELGPAVIPAPIVYIMVAVVKTLVVGFRNALDQSPSLWRGSVSASIFSLGFNVRCLFGGGVAFLIVYCEQIRAFKAGVSALNSLAWDNRIGPSGFILLVSKAGVMINRDSWGRSY